MYRAIAAVGKDRKLYIVAHNLDQHAFQTLWEELHYQKANVVNFTHAMLHDSSAQVCMGCRAALEECIEIAAEEDEHARRREASSTAARQDSKTPNLLEGKKFDAPQDGTSEALPSSTQTGQEAGSRGNLDLAAAGRTSGHGG